MRPEHYLGNAPEGPRPPGDGDGRIARSWRLTKIAWGLVRRDPTLLGLALASTAVGAVMVAILVAVGAFDDRGRMLIAVVVLLFPSTFLGTFLNVAIAAAADARLRGERLGARDALRVPAGRVRQVALWSLLAAGVGTILQVIADKVPFGGRVASWALGAAWGLVTFFVVPILAVEGCTARHCVTRSSRLMRDRWGESLTGTIAIGAWAVVPALPGGILVGIGVAMYDEGMIGAGVFFLAIGGLILLASTTLATATRQVFAVAVYRHALDGGAHGGFAESDLARPVQPKRRWFG